MASFASTCMSCLVVSKVFDVVFVLFISNLVVICDDTASRLAKAKFCEQTHFDSVFFDGRRYYFVVKRPRKNVVEMFTANFNPVSNRFNNFTHKVNNGKERSFVLQSGFYLEFAHLYVEFYYKDPIGYESTFHLDFNVYQHFCCLYLGGPPVHDRALISRHKLSCDCKSHQNLFNTQVLATYTAKHRAFLFEPKSHILWALLHQNPFYFGWIKLKDNVGLDYRNQWTFAHGNDCHLYTGAFIFQGQSYVVQENISHFGFRYPNVVRQVHSLINFTLADFQMPLNQFFNCSKQNGLQSRDAFKFDPDRRMVYFNAAMLILTSTLLAFFVLSLFIAYIICRDNRRIFERIIEKMMRHKMLVRERTKDNSSDTGSASNERSSGNNDASITR